MAAFQLLQVRLQFLFELFGVFERVMLCVLLEKKIKRIDHRHIGNYFNIDLKLSAFFGEYQARQIIAEGVLLPVDKVRVGFDFQAVAVNFCARMGSRAQPYGMRAEINGPVKFVAGAMVNGNANSHKCAQLKIR